MLRDTRTFRKIYPRKYSRRRSIPGQYRRAETEAIKVEVSSGAGEREQPRTIQKGSDRGYKGAAQDNTEGLRQRNGRAGGVKQEVRQRVQQEDGAEEEQGEERRRRGGEEEQTDNSREPLDAYSTFSILKIPAKSVHRDLSFYSIKT